MDDGDYQEGGEDGAARAFAQLGREVSLLRAAIEGLTAARDSIEIPDYQPTLERTEKILMALVHQADELSKKPAMTLTPETLGQRLNAAVAEATRELRHQIGATDTMLRNVASSLSDRLASARRGDEQNRWLLWSGLGSLVLGLLLYAIMAGPIARLMPASWQWPVRMAARTLALPMWDAGQRLMTTANPDAWRGIVTAANLARDNREAIEACQRAAVKAKKAVRCTINVSITAATARIAGDSRAD